MPFRYLSLFALIFAGEAVFILPFHVTRFFRPSVLEVFDLSNAALGDAFAAYGLVAMIAYFIGGPLADRYPPRNLLIFSLLLTTAGGLVMAQIPTAFGLTLLYAFWGLSTILLFWAPLLRATREWGGKLAQGQAFGLLDGGRGLIAAASASLAVILLSWLMPGGLESTNIEDKREALRAVIYLYSGITALAALLVWCFLPPTQESNQASGVGFARNNIRLVLSKPIVWAHAGVIVCAYCAYKGLDNYALYAVEVLGMNDLEAARFTSNAAYLRLFGAILVGLLADKIGAARCIALSFLLLILSYVMLANTTASAVESTLLYGNLFVTFFFAYALRGIYFALLEEIKTPLYLTGTTVGVISVLGYTPDVFFYPIAGRILDANPGVAGHQLYFYFLAALMLLGLLIVAAVMYLNRRDLQPSGR